MAQHVFDWPPPRLIVLTMNRVPLRDMSVSWTIKVLVTAKSEIQWYKKKLSGDNANYFTMELRDSSGVIRAVAFEAEVDRLYDMIQVDKHYYISRGLVKKTKKEYKQVDNDNEIIFKHTFVAECMDID